MNQQTIQQLNHINREFYQITADDFDQTRGTSWSGWERILPYLTTPFSVLDVGCGNGRFGLFLTEHLPAQNITYHGIDSSPALLDRAQQALSQHLTLHITLDQRDIVESPPTSGQYDLVVLLGVMHHIPGAANRLAFIESLAQRVKPGGLLVFACWRFYEYPRFRERITPWPDDLKAQIEPHDYLLDWRRGAVALRYCHYVDDAEHAALITASGLLEVETFRADGQSGDANRYSILRKEL